MERDCESSLVKQLCIFPTQRISECYKDGMFISIQPLTTFLHILGAMELQSRDTWMM